MKKDKFEELAKECHLEYTFGHFCFAQKIKELFIKEALAARDLHESPGLDPNYKTPSSTIATLIDRINLL